MLKKLNILGLLIVSAVAAAPALGQAAPTATALTNVQIGGGFTYARTDYGQKGDKGLTVYGDYDIGVHWGAEAEYHYASISAPNHVSENSVLVGPRLILRKQNLRLYGKGMVGLGHINIDIPPSRVSETDFLFAAGGGVEYLLGHHITLRPIDVEYQRWHFRSGLTPVVVTIGAAYRFR